MNTALSAKAAAKRAGVSLSLVYAWAKEARLAHYRVGRAGKRGQIRIEIADLDAFISTLRKSGQPLTVGG